MQLRNFFFIITCSFSLALSSWSQANPSRREATLQLLKLMDVEKSMDLSLKTSAELIVSKSEVPLKVQPRVEKFLKEHVGYKATEADLAAIYEKHFTADEVKSLIEFYSTAIGKKLISKQAQLYTEGAELAEKKLMDKQNEIQKLLSESEPSKGKTK